MKALFILLALATVCSAQIDVHTIIQRSVEAVRAQLGFCIERRVFRSASGGAPCASRDRYREIFRQEPALSGYERLLLETVSLSVHELGASLQALKKRPWNGCSGQHGGACQPHVS